MKTAVVTGASSGIGLAVCRRLTEMGYRVVGLARDFSKTDFVCDRFVPVRCDVTRTEELKDTVASLRGAEGVSLLVNNAGVGFFGPHETLSPRQIHEMVALNLEAPLVLTGLLLRELKRSAGAVINISSATAKKPSTYACAYAATKAGLTHFSESLFEEVRKAGVRVAVLHPDMTRTDFYTAADFEPSPDGDAALLPEDIADAVEFILRAPGRAAVNELTIRPQKNRIARKPGGRPC